MLLRDAETARRQSWRTFGNFGAWIAITAALCLSAGSLATMALQGRADAKAFGGYTDIYCGSAGGTKFTANDGNEYCAVPVD